MREINDRAWNGEASLRDKNKMLTILKSALYGMQKATVRSFTASG